MDTILITGSEGFFASRFTEYYKDQFNIVALNHRKLDISDEKQTINAIRKINPKYLVHAAAISDTSICERKPELSYDVNVKGTINIAKGCSETQTKLIYLSSDQVYNGNVEAGPYNEDCVVIPNTVYGNHKLEAENSINELLQDVIVLRLTWMFSLPERHKKTNSNIVWNVVRATMKNESIGLPANEYRGITYVYDLLKNFNEILNLPKGIYNAGSENNLSTYEIAKVVLERIGLTYRSDELLIKDIDRFKDNNRDLRISNNKLKKYNIYFTSTEEAVCKCINDFSYQMI